MRKCTLRPVQSLAVLGLVVFLALSSPFGVDGSQRRTKKRKPKVVSCFWLVCNGVTASTTRTVQGGRLTVTANATSPTDEPITYKWIATGGTIEGDGATVEYVASVDTPGLYTVTALLNDGGHTVECSVDIEVTSASVSP
jgi:hypothetical protein